MVKKRLEKIAKEKVSKNRYICTLNRFIQKDIEHKIKRALDKLDCLTSLEKNELIKEGLSGKLSDIEDIIDINCYLN